ncbi:O-acyltransferase like protein-like [Asterias rubens]|uniref:O-acyltransferase like protein-like n=1 Tax=Asterias rubens TaxID=7604 RepID=UPI0014554D82|nr:O-acyltransferase like protein-like [Asterias rubens]
MDPELQMQVLQQLGIDGIPQQLLIDALQSVEVPALNVTEIGELVVEFLRDVAVNSTVVADLLRLYDDLGISNPLQPGGLDVVGLDVILQQFEILATQYLASTTFRNVSAQCLDDMQLFLSDLIAQETYANQMLNSYGSIPTLNDLQLSYNVRRYGSIEECQYVKDWNPTAPFETVSCTVGYPLPIGGAYGYNGICVPASCSNEDLFEMTEEIPLVGEYLMYECIVDYPWNLGAIVTVCICFAFVMLVTIGTAYHMLAHGSIQGVISKTVEMLEKTKSPPVVHTVYQKHLTYGTSNKGFEPIAEETVEFEKGQTEDNEDRESVKKGEMNSSDKKLAATNPEDDDDDEVAVYKNYLKRLGFVDRLLMGFSSITNGAKILSTKEPAGSLGALNGIRVISMFWIILGHTLQFQLSYIENPRYPLMEVVPTFMFSIVLNATLSVDTFFMLSGLLLTYHTLKHLKKTKGRMNWAIFYFHRVWRITPTYMISLAIFASLAIHFGTGPTKNSLFEYVGKTCQDYWWTNLLYINNLYPFPGTLNAQCMGWSWYLANDMQFFVISPFLLYLLYKKARIGLGVIIALCFGSIGVTAYLALYYGAPVGVHPFYNNNTLEAYGTEAADIIYGKPYCRIQSYLVGMIAGYVFFKIGGKPFKMNKRVNALLWLTAFGIGFSVVFGPWREDNDLPQSLAVIYIATSRFAFAIAVALVAFACVVGYGGPINALLSWRVWAPLGRLTFAAYLLHPIIIFVVYLTKNSLYHFTYMQYAYTFVAHLVFSYLAAFLFSIFVEGPMMGLEKTLLGGVAAKNK